jgi:hypothetical protein
VVIDAVADGSKRFTVRDTINSIDILPTTTWNKGSAAQWINRHLNVDVRDSMYVSDDRAMTECCFPAGTITVKVELADNTRAHYVLKDSAEVLTLLKLLLILLRGV